MHKTKENVKIHNMINFQRLKCQRWFKIRFCKELISSQVLIQVSQKENSFLINHKILLLEVTISNKKNLQEHTNWWQKDLISKTYSNYYVFLKIFSFEIIKSLNIGDSSLKGTLHLSLFWKLSFWHPNGFWKIWYRRNQSQKLEICTKFDFWFLPYTAEIRLKIIQVLQSTDSSNS